LVGALESSLGNYEKMKRFGQQNIPKNGRHVALMDAPIGLQGIKSGTA
jgi:hypothetical protein